LVNAQEGRTQGMRQWRFNSIKDIAPGLVKSYLKEAIENQKAGKEIKPKKKAFLIPKELKEVLASNEALSSSFNGLGLTKKREYAEYIGEAKRENTKMARLEKIIPLILTGKGLNDKYR